MDKININVVSQNMGISSDSNVLDVYSICTNKSIGVQDDDNYDILKHKKDVRLKLQELYSNELKKCKQKIRDYNNMKYTDVIYKVPEKIITLPEYDSKKCLDYIEQYLSDNNYDTKIINSYEIFVSWYFYEINGN